MCSTYLTITYNETISTLESEPIYCTFIIIPMVLLSLKYYNNDIQNRDNIIYT